MSHVSYALPTVLQPVGSLAEVSNSYCATDEVTPFKPEGTYLVNIYTVSDKVVLEESVPRTDNTHYDVEKINWNNNHGYIMDPIYGWELPK